MPESKTRKTPANKKGPTPPKKRGPTKKQLNQARLSEQQAQMQGALMGLREMYDQVVLEKQQLQGQIAQRDQLLTALAVEYSGLSVGEDVYATVIGGNYSGYEIEKEDGEIVIVAVDAPELEEEDDGNTDDS